MRLIDLFADLPEELCSVHLIRENVGLVCVMCDQQYSALLLQPGQ